MNACEQFRELILTDYIDGQAGQQTVKQLEEHLRVCPACRELVQGVKDKTVMPFARAGRQEVPHDLWSSIKERIEQERTVSSPDPVRGWLDRLAQTLVWPRFAPVLAGVVLLVSVAVLLAGRLGYQVKENDQQEYWEYVFASSDTAQDALSRDMDTPIEQYFL